MSLLNIFKSFSAKRADRREVRRDKSSSDFQHSDIDYPLGVDGSDHTIDRGTLQAQHAFQSYPYALARTPAGFSYPGTEGMESMNPERVESFRSWSPIPSVYRYPMETVTTHPGISPESQSNMPRRTYKAADLKGYGTESEPRAVERFYYEQDSEGIFPQDLGASYRHPLYNEKVRGKSQAPPYISMYGQPETIEPVVYEHEVWNYDNDEPDLYYYIVPGGMYVIFKDESGNEIARVGNSIKKPRRVSPLILQDEFGNELYRTGDFGRTPRRQEHDEHIGMHSNYSEASMNKTGSSSKDKSVASYALVPSNTINVILIDDQGHQIPIARSSSSLRESNYKRGLHS